MILITILLLFLPSVAFSANITCTGASDHVLFNNAITAAVDGATITVAPGTCSFGSTVSIGSSKGISIIGSGYSNTIINGGFSINGGATKKYRISGFTITGGVTITGSSKYSAGGGWRIDNNKFTSAGVSTFARTYGVIDHNLYQAKTYFGQFFGGDPLGGPSYGWNAWSTDPWANNAADAVYLEDNQWDFTCITHPISASIDDGRNGGRYVLRHNTIKNAVWGSHDAEIGGYRGTQMAVADNNTFIYTDMCSGGAYTYYNDLHRGGTGMITNNQVKYKGSAFNPPYVFLLKISTARWGTNCDATSNKICSVGPGRSCTSDADCASGGGGTCTWNMDGQEDSTGYPCRDQTGVGYDGPNGVQVKQPWYVYNNSYCTGSENCTPNLTARAGLSDETRIVPGRDVIESSPPYALLPYPHPLTGAVSQPHELVPLPPSIIGIN